LLVSNYSDLVDKITLPYHTCSAIRTTKCVGRQCEYATMMGTRLNGPRTVRGTPRADGNRGDRYQWQLRMSILRQMTTREGLGRRIHCLGSLGMPSCTTGSSREEEKVVKNAKAKCRAWGLFYASLWSPTFQSHAFLTPRYLAFTTPKLVPVDWSPKILGLSLEAGAPVRNDSEMWSFAFRLG
jgi:hypothetical protein